MVKMQNLRRFLARAFIWGHILRNFHGLTVFSQLNLFISALIDLLLSFFAKPYNPTLLFPGLYLSSEGLTVFVRGRTDDLYHLVPRREGDVDFLIRRVLRHGDVFVDVGANVGYYTLLAAKKGCKVIAIEPVPQTIAVLKINLRLNRLEDRVIVIDRCAWSLRSKVKLIIPQGKFFGSTTALFDRAEGTIIEVEGIDLDSILRNQPNIRMIKIDVEGLEYEVLKGALDTLKKTDLIVVELSRNAKEIIGFLLKTGYRIKRLRFTTHILAYNVVKIGK